MKTLFYSAIFCLLSIGSFAQGFATVYNNTCEDKEVRVYFDDATAACTGTPINCTPAVPPVIQIVPAGGMSTFTAACPFATTYEVYAQSNWSGAASSRYPTGCRGDYPGITPAIDPCPGPNNVFMVQQGSPTDFEINNL